MPYRFTKNEQLSFGLKRIILEEIDGALNDLSEKSKNVDEEIHSARKHFKKIRAVLRLIRSPLGEVLYSNANIAIRDAARNLALARNTAVMLRTLEKIHFNDENSKHALTIIREHLTSGYETAKITKGESNKIINRTKKLLIQLRSETHHFPINGDDFSLIKDGINEVFIKGRKYFVDSKSFPSDFILHEWRKYIKYLWYDFKLLTNLWPSYFNAIAYELEILAEKLGDINDLALFEKTVNELASVLPAHSPEILLNQLKLKKEKLAIKTLNTGERIFIEKPKAITTRLEDLFILWKTN